MIQLDFSDWLMGTAMGVHGKIIVDTQGCAGCIDELR